MDNEPVGTALGSVTGLIDEGMHGPDPTGLDGLGHCVATYACGCQTGTSVMVSLRSEGLRRSTLELTNDPEGDWHMVGHPYSVGEHRGECNSKPGTEAEAAPSRLKAMLRDEMVIVEATCLDARPSLSRPYIRTDIRDLLPSWRPLLPKPYRRLDIDGLSELVHATGSRLRPDL